MLRLALTDTQAHCRPAGDAGTSVRAGGVRRHSMPWLAGIEVSMVLVALGKSTLLPHRSVFAVSELCLCGKITKHLGTNDPCTQSSVTLLKVHHTDLAALGLVKGLINLFLDLVRDLQVSMVAARDATSRVTHHGWLGWVA